MMYTSQIKKALKLCYSAHLGQYDRQGIPYVFGPCFVAGQMETESEICTALLYEILEDCTLSLQDLQEQGFSLEVLNALNLLRRPRTMSYAAFLERIKADPIALKVEKACLQLQLEREADPASRRFGECSRALQMLCS